MCLLTYLLSSTCTMLYPLQIAVTEAISGHPLLDLVVVIVDLRVKGRVTVHVFGYRGVFEGSRQGFTLKPLAELRAAYNIVDDTLWKDKNCTVNEFVKLSFFMQCRWMNISVISASLFVLNMIKIKAEQHTVNINGNTLCFLILLYHTSIQHTKHWLDHYKWQKLVISSYQFTCSDSLNQGKVFKGDWK